MKAKYIKKLREKILKFDEYEISTACRLFGEPYGGEPLGAAIKSDSPLNAWRKFCRKYRRHYKESNNYYDCYCTTTSQWGKIRVKNLKTGYKYYYR